MIVEVCNYKHFSFSPNDIPPHSLTPRNTQGGGATPDWSAGTQQQGHGADSQIHSCKKSSSLLIFKLATMRDAKILISQYKQRMTWNSSASIVCVATLNSLMLNA